MRIAILCNTFTPNLGYAGNMVPKYLAALGLEVHVLATDLPTNYLVKSFDETYRDFFQLDDLRAGTVRPFDGYQLHILPHRRQLGQMRMVGLGAKLAALRPDIVQCFSHVGWIPFDAAWHQGRLGYRLFTGNHMHASVFPLAQRPPRFLDPALWKCRILRTLPGKLVSRRTELCHVTAPDCAEVAIRFLGADPRKVVILPLGVDCEVFHPIVSEDDREDRERVRASCGFAPDDIVCVYSGRFSEDKNPLLLARAIETLRSVSPRFKGLFIGSGTQKDAIAAVPHCVVRPFVPMTALGSWFRAADIGVWPTQESTSMLDAAACALPVVVNDTVRAAERIDGNGARYRLGDVADLVAVLLRLSDASVRATMGEVGARRMKEEYGWEALVRTRLGHYEAALTMPAT